MQNACLDNISLKSSAHEDWSEFFQTPDTSSGGLQTEEIVEKDNTQDIISTADIDNTGDEKGDSDGWCELDECPSGVTDALFLEAEVAENAAELFLLYPEKGNKPLRIFMDKYSEYLSL